MKIAILHYTSYPVIGGVENVMVDHARLFLKHGHEVTFVSGLGEKVSDLPELKILVLPEIKDESDKDTLKNKLETALKEFDLLIVHNVLHFHFNLTLTSALHELIEAGRIPKTISWCHDISRYINPESGDEQRQGPEWQTLKTYQSQITYVAISRKRQQTLAGILGIDPSQVKVVPDGVNYAGLNNLTPKASEIAEKFNLADGNPIVLMPVRVTQAKNLEYALELTNALKEEGLNPKLVVTGPPDPHDPKSQSYFETLVKKRDELNLQENFYFLRQKENKLEFLEIDLSLVAELIGVSDTVLMTSHREGFGIPAMEGQLLGKIVFTSPIPVVDEVGPEYFHLIDLNAPPTVTAKNMAEVFKNNKEYQAKLYVRQNFTWEAVYRKYITPLLELV